MTGGNGDGNGARAKAPRWLEGDAAPGAQALRQALDEAADDDAPAFARQRVWNRVQVPWAGEPPLVPFAEPRRRRLWPALAVAGVVVAVAGGALLGPRLFPAPAPIAEVPVPAQPRIAPLLPPPASIALTTGPDERARHRLARGVQVRLSARSALIPGDDETPPEVKVGRVRFSVPHQAPGRRYVVRAGAYQVAVLGTTFDVAVDDGGVAVAVESGVVAVEDAASGRRLALLRAGMRWPNGDAVAPRPVRRTRAASPRAAASARAGASARAAVSATADRAARSALDEAGETRRRGDPQAALARYRRLVELGGPMAEIALYDIGLIEAEDLGDRRGALATFERQRRLYPTGLLRAEIDLSIVESLARLGEVERALAEARGFLARHPGSERRAEVARVAGDLARTRGDCRTAVGFYEIGADDRKASDDVDDAAFHRAACLGALGDGRARAAAREYLARFPFGRHAASAQRLLAGGKVDPAGD